MARVRRSKVASGDFFPGFTDIAEIGIGSLATVFRAHEAGTHRQVALKLLNVRDASPRAIESFERESIALGAVSSHPNIVTLYRSFRAADQRPVLVLELCTGSIADQLHNGQGLPVPDVVALGIKVAGALETAHRAGILHRDVKPQNILVTDFGEPALADFGVAMLQSSTQTTAGLFDFTTLHAAPELLEGGATSAATDVYELASTLYQLIAGRAAFRAYEGESPASVILRILRDPVQPLGNARVPTRLSDLLIHAMSKDKENRPTSAAEFAAELAAVEVDNDWPRTRFLVRDLREPGGTAGLPAPARARPSPGPVRSMSPAANPYASPVPPPVRDEHPRPTARDGSSDVDWSAPILSTPTLSTPTLSTPTLSTPTLSTPTLSTPTPSTPPPPSPPPTGPGARASGTSPPDQTVRRSALPQVAWAKRGSGSQTTPEDRPAGEETDEKSPGGLSRPECESAARTGAEHPAAPIVRDRGVPLRIDEDSEIDEPTVSRASLGQIPVAPSSIDQPTTSRASLHRDHVEQAPPPPPPPAAQSRPGVQETVMRSSLFPDAGPQYPIPPAGLGGGSASGAVPTWASRVPTQPPPAQHSVAHPPSQPQMDLRLDPMALRRRMTIRSGASALIIDEQQLVLRSWWRRTQIGWADVMGFEVRTDEPATASGNGHLVAITRNGRTDLPATDRESADLRYLHALLDAYRLRAQMVMRGASPPWGG